MFLKSYNGEVFSQGKADAFSKKANSYLYICQRRMRIVDKYEPHYYLANLKQN